MSTMIFPGMDPYLEHPYGWPTVHNRFIVYAADELQAALGDRYITSVEQRVFLEGGDRDIVPDMIMAASVGRSYPTWYQAPSSVSVSGAEPVVLEAEELEIKETYIAILDRRTNMRVVTVIELLSPSNKLPGSGRKSYLLKQEEVLHSDTHLVEIDLLRAGMHTAASPAVKTAAHKHDYLVSINRAEPPRRKFEVYFLQLREPLPTIRVPVSGDDPPALLNLQNAISRVYESGNYRGWTPYDRPCVPPLSPEDKAWANALISAAGADPPT